MGKDCSTEKVAPARDQAASKDTVSAFNWEWAAPSGVSVPAVPTASQEETGIITSHIMLLPSRHNLWWLIPQICSLRKRKIQVSSPTPKEHLRRRERERLDERPIVILRNGHN